MLRSELRIEPPTDFDERNFLQELEIKVANYFDVYPVDLRTAYQEFRDGDMCRRVIPVSFVVAAEGKQSPKMVHQLCEELWKQITKTFPADSLVVWRVRPTLKEEDDSEKCESCGHALNVRYKTTVRLRLGCLEPMLTQPEFTDGFRVPILEIK